MTSVMAARKKSMSEEKGRKLIFNFLDLDDLSIKTAPNYKFRSDCLKNLQFLSKICYYLFFIPYNPVISDETGSLTFESSLIRKIICCVLHIYTLAAIGLKDLVSVRFSKKIQENPSALFEMAFFICLILAVTIFIYTIWIKTNSLKDSFLTVERMSSHHILSTPWITKGRCGLIFMFLICFTRLKFSVEYFISTTLNYASDGDGQKFLIGMNPSQLINLNGIENPSILLILMCILFYIFELYRTFFTTFTLNFAYFFCIIIYEISAEFVFFLDKQLPNNSSFEQLAQCYMDVNILLGSISKCTSVQILISVVSGMVIMIRNFDGMMNPQLAFFTRAEITTYFLLSAISMGLAAQANSNFQVIYDYVFERKDQGVKTTESEVVILLNEISENQMGLKAHTFTITYSFIATVFSTVLTYVFIFLQFGGSTSKTD